MNNINIINETNSNIYQQNYFRTICIIATQFIIA